MFLTSWFLGYSRKKANSLNGKRKQTSWKSSHIIGCILALQIPSLVEPSIRECSFLDVVRHSQPPWWDITQYAFPIQVYGYCFLIKSYANLGHKRNHGITSPIRSMECPCSSSERAKKFNHWFSYNAWCERGVKRHTDGAEEPVIEMAKCKRH